MTSTLSYFRLKCFLGNFYSLISRGETDLSWSAGARYLHPEPLRRPGALASGLLGADGRHVGGRRVGACGQTGGQQGQQRGGGHARRAEHLQLRSTGPGRAGAAAAGLIGRRTRPLAAVAGGASRRCTLGTAHGPAATDAHNAQFCVAKGTTPVADAATARTRLKTQLTGCRRSAMRCPSRDSRPPPRPRRLRARRHRACLQPLLV